MRENSLSFTEYKESHPQLSHQWQVLLSLNRVSRKEADEAVAGMKETVGEPNHMQCLLLYTIAKAFASNSQMQLKNMR